MEGIEPHPEKDDTQIVTFKDRRTAENVILPPSPPFPGVSQADMLQFIHTSAEIPSVGEVSLGWYNVPSGPLSAKQSEERAEIKMEQPEDQHSIPTGDHADDDVYEDDEGRWLPE